MMSKILIFLVLSVVVVVVTTGSTHDGNRFFCDQVHVKREVQNAKETLQRIIHRKGTTYLIFQSRILYFKNLIFEPVPDSTMPKLLQRNVYEIENKETPLTELGVPAEYRVMGYVHDDKTRTLVELYAPKVQTKTETEYLEFGYKLKFDSSLPPGTRTERINVNDLWTYYWLDDKQKERLKVKDVLVFQGTTKYVEIYDGDSHSAYAKNYFVTYSFQYLDLQFCFTVWNRVSTAFCYNFATEEYKWMKSFVSYMTNVKMDSSGGHVEFDLYIFGVEEDNAIHLFYHHFKSDWGKALLQKELKLRWTFDDLLSCHTPWTDQRQLKGVVYNKKSKIFYVFVKRFYLKIQNELVQNGFELDQDDYEKNAYDLIYPDDATYDDLLFDMTLAKFVKNLPEKTYYMANWGIYELDFDDQDMVRINKPREKEIKDQTSEAYFIHECSGQIVVIEKVYAYCFRGTKYVYYHLIGKTYKWEAERKKFATYKIFEDLKIGYFSNQSLEFTFNYGENQIAFLTDTDLWLFKYEGFRREPDYSLIYTDKHVRLRNCFFAKCPVLNSTETTPTTEITSPPTTKKRITRPRPLFTTPPFNPLSPVTIQPKPSEKRLNDLYFFLIIAGGLLLIAGLVYTCYLISKRDSFDEGLSRREVC